MVWPFIPFYYSASFILTSLSILLSPLFLIEHVDSPSNQHLPSFRITQLIMYQLSLYGVQTGLHGNVHLCAPTSVQFILLQMEQVKHDVSNAAKYQDTTRCFVFL